MSGDGAQIVLDLMSRLTASGNAPSRQSIEAVRTEDAEQVNALGMYSAGREAIISTAQRVIGAAKTVGTTSEIVSATLLRDDVILAHVLSVARVSPDGETRDVQFRFTIVMVRA